MQNNAVCPFCGDAQPALDDCTFSNVDLPFYFYGVSVSAKTQEEKIMRDYNELTWWQKFKAFWGTDGHVHTWDTGHYWYDNPDNKPDGTDGGFYYLCTGCGQRKVESYPC